MRPDHARVAVAGSQSGKVRVAILVIESCAMLEFHGHSYLGVVGFRKDVALNL